MHDGSVHSQFSPYDTPFEAFTNYMNVLADFIVRVEEQYPMSIENEELSALLTTIRNQEREIETLNKEAESMRKNIEHFNEEHLLREQQEAAKKAEKKPAAKKTAEKTAPAEKPAEKKCAPRKAKKEAAPKKASGKAASKKVAEKVEAPAPEVKAEEAPKA